MWLIDHDDAQLQSSLGLTVEDVALLRSGPAKSTSAAFLSTKPITSNTLRSDYLYKRIGHRACPHYLES